MIVWTLLNWNLWFALSWQKPSLLLESANGDLWSTLHVKVDTTLPSKQWQEDYSSPCSKLSSTTIATPLSVQPATEDKSVCCWYLWAATHWYLLQVTPAHHYQIDTHTHTHTHTHQRPMLLSSLLDPHTPPSATSDSRFHECRMIINQHVEHMSSDAAVLSAVFGT